MAGGIDGGPWSESLKDVKLVVNAAVMRKAETTFQAGGTGSTDTPGEMSRSGLSPGQQRGILRLFADAGGVERQHRQVHPAPGRDAGPQRRQRRCARPSCRSITTWESTTF